MQLLHYQWPVQDIGPFFLPLEAPAMVNHILGFRDIDDKVQFIALKTMTARLVVLLGNGLSGQQALDEISTGISLTSPCQFMQFGLETLSELHRRGAIINVRSA